MPVTNHIPEPSIIDLLIDKHIVAKRIIKIINERLAESWTQDWQVYRHANTMHGAHTAAWTKLKYRISGEITESIRTYLHQWNTLIDKSQQQRWNQNINNISQLDIIIDEKVDHFMGNAYFVFDKNNYIKYWHYEGYAKNVPNHPENKVPNQIGTLFEALIYFEYHLKSILANG